MGFSQYYNWLKYNFFAPSFFFKNRLHIERQFKKKFIYSHYIYTYKGFNWNQLQTKNLTLFIYAYLNKKFTTYLFIIFLFLITLYLLKKSLIFFSGTIFVEIILYIYWRIFDTLYFYFFNILYILLTICMSYIFLFINTFTPANLNIYRIISRHFLDESLSFNKRYWSETTIPQTPTFLIYKRMPILNFKLISNDIKTELFFFKDFYNFKITLFLFTNKFNLQIKNIFNSNKFFIYSTNNKFFIYNNIINKDNFYNFNLSNSLFKNLWSYNNYNINFFKLKKLSKWLYHSNNLSSFDFILNNNFSQLTNNINFKNIDNLTFLINKHWKFSKFKNNFTLRPEFNFNLFYKNNLNLFYNKEWFFQRNFYLFNNSFIFIKTFYSLNFNTIKNSSNLLIQKNSSNLLSMLFYTKTNSIYKLNDFNNLKLYIPNNITYIFKTNSTWNLKDLNFFYNLSSNNSFIYEYLLSTKYWYMYYFRRNRYFNQYPRYKRFRLLISEDISFLL